MSLKFEQLDSFIKSDFGDGFGDNTEPDTENNMSILDEFLDKRLYEDHATTSNHNNHSQGNNTFGQVENAKDEEIFNNFLTDEINKNDFVLFSPSANISAGDSSMDIDFNENNSFVPPLSHLTATTPISIDTNSPDAKSEIFHTPPNTITTENSYENARNIFSNLKFGTEAPTQYNNEFPKEYLDVDADTLPYKLVLQNLPSHSRVETQIKLELNVSPPPPQFLVQLPKDTIAKQKFCLADPLTDDIKQNILSLETFVLTASSMKPCNTCTRCVRREQKRASRRKSGVTDNLNWTTNTNKRAIIFNCKEIISFPPTSSNDNSKNIDISARIVCYCRHHSENKGFRLLFILTNSANEILAKTLSTPIMIMDRKKNADDSNPNLAQATNSDAGSNGLPSNSSVPAMKVQPLSPTSIEEDSSEPQATDSGMFKRKKTWSPELSDGFSITPKRKLSSGINLPSTINIPSTRPNDSIPIIQRIIPAQGPLRGGIEVTLLGTNFKQGLNVNFGINKALSTQCWSDSTMVTYLPPASQPGQVIVTVSDPEQLNEGENKGSSIFTYLDDSDRQMIELALQIVGLKMNGKLEDARNIAKKIIGSESSGGDSSSVLNPSPINITGFNSVIDQFTSGLNSEDSILKVIAMLPTNPNLSICTPEAQTLLHLSSLKGYYRLVSSLLHKGARADVRDTNGYTPLHFASIAGHRKCIELLMNFRASCSIKNNNGETPADVANLNVLDLLKSDDLNNFSASRKFSCSSISSSIFSVEEFTSGAHVSRLTTDRLADSYSEDYSEDDFSDDEDIEASDEESEFDPDYQQNFTAENQDLSSFSTDGANNVSNSTDNHNNDDSTSDKKSIWKKVRNVFNEELPKYDDLFPNRSWKLASFTQSSVTSTSAELDTSDSNSETTDIAETEDIFQKFFQQRKNIQNDKMLLFVWLPLLILIVGSFILLNAGWKFEFKEYVEEFIRKSLGAIMLGNERVKVVLNRQLSQVNEAMTSVINVN